MGYCIISWSVLGVGVVNQPLNSKQYALLLQIVHHVKCFDKRDNTILLSNRKLADKLRVSPSKVDQLIRILKKNNLIKLVKATSEVRIKGVVSPSKPLRMLSPKFMWWSYTKTDRIITGALYEFGCIEQVRKWRTMCRNLDGFIDPETGELKEYNWYYIDKEAYSYCIKWDRCRRVTDRYKGLGDSGFTLQDAYAEEISPYDVKWFNEIKDKKIYV